jgi:hypothetical protein
MRRRIVAAVALGVVVAVAAALGWAVAAATAADAEERT